MSAVILAKKGSVKAVAANVQLTARAQNAKEQHANVLMVSINILLDFITCIYDPLHSTYKCSLLIEGAT